MLFKTALVLLVGWMLGPIGLYEVGDIVHVLLLVGLLLLLLAVAKSRDVAAHRAGINASANRRYLGSSDGHPSSLTSPGRNS
jgi:hypothetical protein